MHPNVCVYIYVCVCVLIIYIIDPLPKVWLTGDLTNIKGESAILSEKTNQ